MVPEPRKARPDTARTEPDPADRADQSAEPAEHAKPTEAPAIRVLGPLEIGPPSRPTRVEGKLTRLLAVLVANVNEPVTVERLSDALWGDDRPATFEAGLRGHLSRARAVLAKAGCELAIVARSWGDEPGYCLEVDPDQVDHTRFSRLVERSGVRAATAAELEEALRLWRGAPFSGIDLLDVQPTIFKLEDRCLALTERLAQLYVSEGRASDAVALLFPQHSEHLDRETTCAGLARALFTAGRQREALEVCRATTTYLREEFGLEPTSTVTDVEQLILQNDGTAASGPETRWDPAPDALLQRCTGPFVGRDVILGRLQRMLADVGDHGVSVLVTGGIGMGKTRLLAEAARVASRDGARCIHVAVDPVSPAPFHVGVALMGRLQLDLSPSVAAASRAVLDAVESHRTTAEPAEAQHGLERRLDELVRAVASQPTPVLMFVDDAQWIDSGSLSIIRHLTGVGGRNLGVVLAARRGDHGASWDDFVALVPSSPIETMVVGPLSTDDIADWMAQLGLDVGVATATIAATVHRETEGVAFVVAATLQELATTDPIGALERLRDGLVPETLYDPVRARIERLDEHDAQLLAVAAVMSTHPDPEEVAAVCRSLFGPGDWLIDERRCLGLVRIDPTRPGDFVFEHSITRAVLQDRLSQAERRFVHRAAAGGRATGTATAAEAFHLVEAIPLVDPAVALEAVRDAAAEATAVFAFEEAAVLHQKALAIHRRFPQPGGADAQLDLRIELARAMQYLGAREAALELFAETMRDAAAVGSWDTLTRGALAAADFGEVLDPDDPVRRLLLTGLDLLPADHPGRRPLAVEAIIKSTIVEGATERVRDMFRDELSAIADDDPAAIQRRRAWLHMSAGSPNAAERLREAELLRAVSPNRTGRDWLDATLFQLSAELELGRTAHAERLHTTYDVAATQSGRPGVKWLAAVTAADLAQIRGRLGDGRAHAERALRYGLDHAVPDAVRSHAGHVLISNALTGALEMPLGRAATRALAAAEDPVLLAAAALLLALEGRRAEAGPTAADAAWLIGRTPSSTLTPFSIALCAEAWMHLDRAPELGDELVPLVLPYRGTMWRMALVGASLGPVDRHLGALLLVQGSREDGLARLADAVVLSRRAEAPVWELASALERVRYGGDEADRDDLLRLSRMPTVRAAGAVVADAEEVLAHR